MDEGWRDHWLRWLALDHEDSRVAVIDIDENSLKELGPWPWRRAQLADLVESLLVDQQVAGVALDIVFPSPADVDGDARLLTLAQHAPLVLAQVMDYVKRPSVLNQGVLGNVNKLRSESTGTPVQAYGFIANHESLAQAPCVGNVGYIPDDDGTIRRLPIITQFEGRSYPTLSLALILCSSGKQAFSNVAHVGMWRLPYRFEQSSYRVIPANQILAGKLATKELQGRLVLVGSSALGLGDQVSTPLSPLTAGVMVHAAALSALLEMNQPQSKLPVSGVFLLAVALMVFVILIRWALPLLSAWKAVATVLTVAVLWIPLTACLVLNGIDISLTAPLWTLAWLLVASVPLEWWITQRHSRKLAITLSHYVAPTVLDEILRRNLAHSLDPQLRHITVMVADMAGYTRMTSSLCLEDAADLTKTFLECLTKPILDNFGTLDRYSGDGLVAFWGAPLPATSGPDQAVSAAMQILDAVSSLNRERLKVSKPALQVRLGIESGLALVGDLGTKFRSTYTAVGDCINFASRLESECQNFGTPLLLGPRVCKEISIEPITVLGNVQLRNTDAVIEVATLTTLRPPSE